MKKKTLKILLVIVLMMSIVLCLTACGDDNDDDRDTSNKKSSSSEDSSIGNEEILTEAEIASKKTKVALAEEILTTALKSAQMDYMMSDEYIAGKSFGDYLTYERLEDLIDEGDYELIDDKNNYKDNQKVEGLDLYMEEDDNEENVYHFVISASGNIGAKVDSICLVDKNGKDIDLDKSSTSSLNKELEDLNVKTFNQIFTDYEGKILGSEVSELLDKIISNNTANKNNDDKLIDVIYMETRDVSELSGSKDLTSDEEEIVRECGMSLDPVNKYYIEVDDDDLNNDVLQELQTSKIPARHYFQVACHKDDDDGLIDCVVISYDVEE